MAKTRMRKCGICGRKNIPYYSSRNACSVCMSKLHDQNKYRPTPTGKGEWTMSPDDPVFDESDAAECPSCLGTGEIYDDYLEDFIDCPSCDGMGVVYSEIDDEGE